MRITTKDIETFKRLRDKRAALEKQEETLRKRLMDGLREQGGSVTRGIWTCALVPYAGQPSWKTEFIRVAGDEAAQVLLAAAPKHDRIIIKEI